MNVGSISGIITRFGLVHRAVSLINRYDMITGKSFDIYMLSAYRYFGYFPSYIECTPSFEKLEYRLLKVCVGYVV